MNATISLDSLLTPLLSLSKSNQKWLADHLRKNLGEEEKSIGFYADGRELTEAERDYLFEKALAEWKKNPSGDTTMEVLKSDKNIEKKKRELAYFEDL